MNERKVPPVLTLVPPSTPAEVVHHTQLCGGSGTPCRVLQPVCDAYPPAGFFVPAVVERGEP